MTNSNQDDENEMLQTVQASNLRGVKFVFPDEISADDRNQRIGLCVTLAAGFYALNPELNHPCISQIVFTTDVWKTVAELEQLSGGQLDAARNGAEQMMLFFVDIGEFNILVIRDEWISLLHAADEARGAALWLFAQALTTAHFTIQLKAKFGDNKWFSMATPLGQKVFTLGREVLHSYWRGYFGFMATVETDAPFNGVREAVPQEMKELNLAFKRFGDHANINILADDAYQSAYFLAVNMAVAIGYADAAKTPVSLLAPDVLELVQKAELTQLWVDLGAAARDAFAERQNWSSFRDILPVGHVGILFLERLGIHYEEGGQVVAKFSPPIRKLH